MKKLFYVINFTLGIFLPIFSINIITNKSDPNIFFPLIFVCLGFCNTLLGINLLNAQKKFLSISSFILAGFLFVLVGGKIVMYS